MKIQFGSVLMLTLCIVSCITLGGALTIKQDKSTHETWDEEAEAAYEKLQFHGTIINFSSKTLGGTADRSWGKWMPGKSPVFPVRSFSKMIFAAQGRESATSGTEGEIKLFVPGTDGELKIHFDCPNWGSNKCDISGNIPGLKMTREVFSGTSGSKAYCTLEINDA